MYSMMYIIRSRARRRKRLIAGGWARTSTPLREGDFKAERKGRRINDLLIRRPFPFTVMDTQVDNGLP